MDLEWAPFKPSDANIMHQFLNSENWPYHSNSNLSPDKIKERIDNGFYWSDDTKTFWIISESQHIGFCRLFDLGNPTSDETPLFDLRIAESFRNKGIGTLAVKWLTRYIFTEYLSKFRIEAITRYDNLPMIKTLIKCGYVKEAHYRKSWKVDGADRVDCVGFALLKEDWKSGKSTAVQW